MKEIRKQKKRKEKRRKKIEKGLGRNLFGPALVSVHGPNRLSSEPVRSPALTSLTAWTHTSGHLSVFFLALTSPETELLLP
jgi:hypothetical protein